MQDKSYIIFWRQNERYGCFSNWYETPFTIDGVSYRWTEQFMMAEKARLFNDDEADQKIMKAGSPNECKKLVLPYNPDAWIDKTKTKVGYEIPFTRTFYKYQKLEPASEIAKRIESYEHSLMKKLHALFSEDGE